MSVAFRREGDDEHLEPKFEIPLPPGPNLVTARGLALIEAKVAELEAALPGVTEEAQVTAARRELRYWRTRLATARLMDRPDGSCVAFGCRVSLTMSGKQQTITIVDDDEASPQSGLLAFSAPLCRAIMDAEVGERVPFGGKADAIEILAIDLPERWAGQQMVEDRGVSEKLVMIDPGAAFKDNLQQLPAVDGVSRIDLLDPDGVTVSSIENQPGKQGSLAVYQYLKQAFKTLDAEAAEHGLLVFAEHTADARNRPGAHPNIDRLLAIAAGGTPLAIEVIAGDS